VHKKMLAVVVADVEVVAEYRFERLKVGTSPSELRALADWLVEREVEVVEEYRFERLKVGTSPSTSAFAARRVSEMLEMSVPQSRVSRRPTRSSDTRRDISSEDE